MGKFPPSQSQPEYNSLNPGVSVKGFASSVFPENLTHNSNTIAQSRFSTKRALRSFLESFLGRITECKALISRY
jgi:hypothetical protein